MNQRARSLRKLLLRLLLVLGSAAFGLFLLDLALLLFPPFGIEHFRHRRAYEKTFIRPSGDPTVVFELQRNRQVEAGVLYRTNNVGGRGKAVSIPKERGVYRILFVGDSNTFGWGVAEEDLFVTRVERILNASAASARFECVNLGAMAYNAVQEAALVLHRGLEFEPDMVCIVFCLNDVFVESRDQDYVRIEREMLMSGRSAFDRFMMNGVMPLAKKCFLPHVHDFLVYLFISRHHDTYYEWVERFYEGIDEGFGLVTQAFSRFNRYGKASGFEPVIMDLSGSERLEAFCGKEGLFYVSIHDRRIQREPEYWNSPCDPHPNAKGHAFYAERIVEGLKPYLVSAGRLEK